MHFAGLGIADPEFDRFGREIHERESLSVSGPDGHARARAHGKHDRSSRSTFGRSSGDVHQFEARGAGRDAVTAGVSCLL